MKSHPQAEKEADLRQCQRFWWSSPSYHGWAHRTEPRRPSLTVRHVVHGQCEL